MVQAGGRQCMKLMRAAIVSLLVLSLFGAGCATRPSSPSSSPSQPPVNLSGYNAAFRQGYTDGCNSARSAMRRDERRYRSDGDYMMGWNDGHSVCQRR